MESLRRIEKTLGRSFSALYQGRPVPADGGLFQRCWFRVVPKAPESCAPHRGPLQWVRFWDTAAGARQHNDCWAGAPHGSHPDGEWFIRDIVRGRWEYPDAKQVVLRTAATDGRSVAVGIEQSASGMALLQDLRRDRKADGFAFWPVRITVEKAVRAGVWASLAQGRADRVGGRPVGGGLPAGGGEFPAGAPRRPG